MLKKFTSGFGIMLLRDRLLRQHKNPATLIKRLERELTPKTLSLKYYDPSYTSHRIIPFGRNMMVYAKKISGIKVQGGESTARKEFNACAKLLRRKINVVRPLGIILSKGNEFFLSEKANGLDFLSLRSLESFANAKYNALNEGRRGTRIEREIARLDNELLKSVKARNDAMIKPGIKKGMEAYYELNKEFYVGGKMHELIEKIRELNNARHAFEKTEIKKLGQKLSPAYPEFKADALKALVKAVEDANNKGVLFHDLAPRNVIVAEEKGKLKIYFLDFEDVLIQDRPLTEAQRLEQARIFKANFKELI